ncbi:MAG TPA: MFS transporter [Xanthobacteraceae bacterium]
MFLAMAAFSSQAMVRVMDSLLPQVAADLNATVGATSIVVTMYMVSHGMVQLIIGPVGDRFGKIKSVTFACAMASLLVMLCGFANSLSFLAMARLGSGLAAGWIIPLSMAYIGDVIPYERRQQVLGTYLSGQILGQLFGQAAGGILGDLLGWRVVFFVLAGMLAVAALALVLELVTNPVTRIAPRQDNRPRGFVADYAAVFGNRWARTVLIIAFLEGIFAWGAFTYVGAHLHLGFGLSFTYVGLIVGAFAIGGLLYSLSVRRLVHWFGQTGLAAGGGCVLALAYFTLAFSTVWWLAPAAVLVIGLGFYMLHNTLQTNATQMTPEARGTAVAVFSSALYLGQMVGVALGSPIFDRYAGVPLFIASAVGLAALGLFLAHALRQRASMGHP